MGVIKKSNVLLSLIEKHVFGSEDGNISTLEKSLDLVMVPFPCILHQNSLELSF